MEISWYKQTKIVRTDEGTKRLGTVHLTWRGGGGKKNDVGKFDKKKIKKLSASDMGSKNILKPLFAWKKKLVFVGDKTFPLCRKAKKIWKKP